MTDDVIILGGRRYYDPLLCLLLFAAAANGGRPSEVMQQLGVDERRIEEILSGNEQELAHFSDLAAAAELMDRRTLGKLLRLKLAELLLSARKGTELSALTRAAAKLPPWALGDEQPAPEQAASTNGQAAGEHGGFAAGGQAPAEDMTEEEAISEARRLLAEIDRTERLEVDLQRLRTGAITEIVAVTPEEAAAGAGGGVAPDR